MNVSPPELRDRLPQKALDLLDNADGRYSEWATACAIAMHAMNAGLTEREFVTVAAASDFAWNFATEDGGRDRSNRLESRLWKAWNRVEDAWCPPISERNDVRQRLEALSQRIAERRWSGQTASKDRAVALGLVAWAHEVGTWTLDAGTRDLALRSAVAHSTAKRALHRLATLGLVSRDHHTERQSTHSQRWVLNLDWELTDNIDPHDLATTGGKGLCGLNLSVSHPVFLGAALGQTAERLWLDLAEHPDSTAGEVADRLGVKVRTVRRVLDTKLVSNGLVEESGSRPGRGRPASMYRLSANAPRLDDVAESFGVLDWQSRTADRYERERAGYREVQRRSLARALDRAKAEHGETWWVVNGFDCTTWHRSFGDLTTDPFNP